MFNLFLFLCKENIPNLDNERDETAVPGFIHSARIPERLRSFPKSSKPGYSIQSNTSGITQGHTSSALPLSVYNTSSSVSPPRYNTNSAVPSWDYSSLSVPTVFVDTSVPPPNFINYKNLLSVQPSYPTWNMDFDNPESDWNSENNWERWKNLNSNYYPERGPKRNPETIFNSDYFNRERTDYFNHDRSRYPINSGLSSTRPFKDRRRFYTNQYYDQSRDRRSETECRRNRYGWQDYSSRTEQRNSKRY